MKRGYIIRTQASWASDEEIKNDQKYLSLRWQKIIDEMKKQGAPALLYEDLNLHNASYVILQPRKQPPLKLIHALLSQSLTEWAKFIRLRWLIKFTITGPRPLFDVANVEEEIKTALSRRVELKSGGYLIFDHNEALTVLM